MPSDRSSDFTDESSPRATAFSSSICTVSGLNSRRRLRTMARSSTSRDRRRGIRSRATSTRDSAATPARAAPRKTPARSRSGWDVAASTNSWSDPGSASHREKSAASVSLRTRATRRSVLASRNADVRLQPRRPPANSRASASRAVSRSATCRDTSAGSRFMACDPLAARDLLARICSSLSL